LISQVKLFILVADLLRIQNVLESTLAKVLSYKFEILDLATSLNGNKFAVEGVGYFIA